MDDHLHFFGRDQQVVRLLLYAPFRVFASRNSISRGDRWTITSTSSDAISRSSGSSFTLHFGSSHRGTRLAGATDGRSPPLLRTRSAGRPAPPLRSISGLRIAELD